MAPKGKKTMTAEERNLYERERKRKYRAKLSEEKKTEIRAKYREYDQNKRKKLADLTPREQRKRRRQANARVKKCRERIKQQKMAEDFVRSNTPDSISGVPVAPHDMHRPILRNAMIQDDGASDASDGPSHAMAGVPGPSRQRVVSRKKKMLERSRLFRENVRLKQKLALSNRRFERLRKRIYRKRSLQPITTPDKILNDLIEGPSHKISEKVKRKLVYNELVVRHLAETQHQLKGVKEKEQFCKVVTPPKLVKYKLFNEHELVSYKAYNRIVKKAKCITTKFDKQAKMVGAFLEEDANSRICSGKKETVTKKKVKKQKRYLLDSLKNLHKKFVKETKSQISYNTFVRMRPFWVCFPKVDDRDTCVCIIHANFNFILKVLFQNRLLDTYVPTDVLSASVCSPDSSDGIESCFSGSCSKCANKLTITVPHEMLTKNVKLYQWETLKESIIVKGKQKEVRKVDKRPKLMSIKELIEMFYSQKPRFTKHVYEIKQQYKAIKDLKASMKSDELLFHLDFSENYALKYGAEIQSMHFGGSRKQVSLHTGVIYYRKEDEGKLLTASFTTMSENLDHGAHGIIAHMKPIFELSKQIKREEDITRIHFLTDSPSSQYRNRFTINYMQIELSTQFKNLRTWVWNYSVAGHGKGAPDGIGAVIKRTADNKVAQGCDIANVSDLFEILLSSCPGVRLFVIESNDIQRCKNELATVTATKLRGIMKIHQIVWHRYSARLHLTELSHYPLLPIKLDVDEVYGNEDDGCNCNVGDYVVVTYDQKNFPGKVIAVDVEEVTVSCMSQCGWKANVWKWPNPPDVLPYFRSNVVQKIKPPRQLTSQSRLICYEIAELM